MEMRWRAFRCSAFRSRMAGCARLPAMTPDSAPTVQQLLAFYLEAGVDCALTDAPVNRLADPDMMPAASETALPKPVRMAAPIPIQAPRGEASPAPEAAIQSAREAART